LEKYYIEGYLIIAMKKKKEKLEIKFMNEWYSLIILGSPRYGRNMEHGVPAGCWWWCQAQAWWSTTRDCQASETKPWITSPDGRIETPRGRDN
jgi:hypothetical protein